MNAKVLVVVGAGPGIGAALARRFGREGYAVGLIARSSTGVTELTDDLRGEGLDVEGSVADIADEAALRVAVGRLAERFGRIDVLHYNPSVFRQRDPLHLSVSDLLDDVRVGVGGLLTAVQAARPSMGPGARVTATGSMAADEPWHEACSLGVQKAGLRNLVLSLDRTLASSGVRAVSVTVRGTLAPGTPFAPERVAEAIFAAASTPDETWRTEVPYLG